MTSGNRKLQCEDVHGTNAVRVFPKSLTSYISTVDHFSFLTHYQQFFHTNGLALTFTERGICVCSAKMMGSTQHQKYFIGYVSDYSGCHSLGK